MYILLSSRLSAAHGEISRQARDDRAARVCPPMFSAKNLHFHPKFSNFALVMPQEQSHIKERQRTDLREPPRYKVTIHNDDFTPMDFVVKVLTQVFFKQPAEAEQLMLQVHHSDKAVVGIYTYDIAVSKVRKATIMARKEGFPLRLTYEPD